MKLPGSESRIVGSSPFDVGPAVDAFGGSPSLRDLRLDQCNLEFASNLVRMGERVRIVMPLQAIDNVLLRFVSRRQQDVAPLIGPHQGLMPDMEIEGRA